MSLPDVRTFTVGPIQENAHFVRADPSASRALLIDPGEDPERLLAAAESLGIGIEAILVTHCHFDHIAALAPIAKATGAPVYCPQLERRAMADIMRWVPPGFGPYESHEPEHLLAGGERLRLAGMDIEVLFTPGHSAGHLAYAISRAGEEGQEGGGQILLSGDLIFAGSVGRVDLPGGDWATLERSIAELVERFPEHTVLHPGHMSSTTLGQELATNPFLTEIRAARLPAPDRVHHESGIPTSGS